MPKQAVQHNQGPAYAASGLNHAFALPPNFGKNQYQQAFEKSAYAQQGQYVNAGSVNGLGGGQNYGGQLSASASNVYPSYAAPPARRGSNLPSGHQVHFNREQVPNIQQRKSEPQGNGRPDEKAQPPLPDLLSVTEKPSVSALINNE